MKPTRRHTLTFVADKEQIKALQRHASTLEDGQSISELLREALSEYLARHAREPQVLSGAWAAVRRQAGTAKTPPRIVLHLRDPRRLELLRLQARTLPGTHRTVGRVIRAAVDEYLRAHARELIEFLRPRKDELRDKPFQTWERQVVSGELYGGRGSGELVATPVRRTRSKRRRR